MKMSEVKKIHASMDHAVLKNFPHKKVIKEEKMQAICKRINPKESKMQIELNIYKFLEQIIQQIANLNYYTKNCLKFESVSFYYQ